MRKIYTLVILNHEWITLMEIKIDFLIEIIIEFIVFYLSAYLI